MRLALHIFSLTNADNMHSHKLLKSFVFFLIIFLILENAASVLELSDRESNDDESSPGYLGDGQRTPRAGRQGQRRHRPSSKIERNPIPSRPRDPIRRQEPASPIAGPGLDIPHHTSPIEFSLGGLTGLQGLPPLSIIQFVKLLVAVTPFIIPLIFVPILIFTVGMFMIPVKKPTVFVGAGGDGPVRKRSLTISNLIPGLSNVARNFISHEECFERLVCEISSRYLKENDSSGIREEKSPSNNMNYRSVIGRVANKVNHPLMRRLSTGVTLPKTVCKQQKCGLISFFEKSFNTDSNRNFT